MANVDLAVRKEILPSVQLTCIQTEKFKTNCMSINLLTPLDRKTAAMNGMLPAVLMRGTVAHPDMESLSAAMDDLYGATITPAVRKLGEWQIPGLYAEFVDDAYVPQGEKLLEKTADLLGEILLAPATSGGWLRGEYVDSEREQLMERIRSRIVNKNSYAVSRLIELMCSDEAYGTDRLGSLQEAEKIKNGTLTKHYKELLADSEIEVFYCGSADPQRVAGAVIRALAQLPRSEEPPQGGGTEIRLTPAGEPRYFEERLEVTQGKLAMGFRMGEYMLSPNYAALQVFNAAYGGSVTSKLFENVREKLSLCYYASSSLDKHKGVLLVSSGIEFAQYDRARSEILHQLDQMKAGEITPEEMLGAKRYVASTLRSYADSPSALESFYLGQALEGLDYGPEDLAVMVEAVEKEEVVEIAKGVELDATYFLKGQEA